jgi:hypothetical protein
MVEVTERPSTKPPRAAHLYLTKINALDSTDVNSDLLRFKGKVETVNGKTRSSYNLIDSGASHCYIDKTFARTLGLAPKLCGRMKVTTAGRPEQEQERWQVYLKHATIRGERGNTVDVSGWYTIYDLNGCYDLIIGKSWMAKNPHLIDYHTNTLHILDAEWSQLTMKKTADLRITATLYGLRPHQGREQEVAAHCEQVAARAGIHLVTADEVSRALAKPRTRHLWIVDVRERLDKLASEGTDGDPKFADVERWRNRIKEEFGDLFLAPTGLPPRTKDDFRIEIDPHAKPPHRTPYRMTYAEQEEFEQQILKLLQNGWVTDSRSRFAAPVIFVRKADGSLRMCVDYRGLNKITVKDRYPLPYIEDLLDKLHGGTIFTKLDLASGYHQLRIHPDDCHKTAFVTPMGFYEWKVIPFGLANAPSAFMRHMHRILHSHKRYAAVYLDDVLIHSRTIAEHKEHVQAVLLSIRKAGLKLNGKKCQFGMREVIFVGFRVTKDGVHTEEKKVAAVRNWATPTSASQLRSFLGLAGYYRKFVDKFAHRTTLLYDLTKDGRGPRSGSRWKWGSIHQQQFDDIKLALTTAPVLATMDPEADFILRCDASDYAIGGVLAQRQQIGGRTVERPLGYFSRKLHAVERRYPTYDRELLAIHDNLEYWAAYIHGRKRTTIYTDHSSLQHILGQRKLSSRQWRHLAKLQEHEYEIKYYPGAANIVADALSRQEHTGKTIAASTCGTPAAIPVTVNLTRMEVEIQGNAELLHEIRSGLEQDEEFAPLVAHFRASAESKEESGPPLGHLSQKQLRRNRRIAARARWFEWHDSLLFYKQGEDRDDFRLCIPDTVQQRVLRDLHDSELGGGHLGASKLAYAVSKRFYWKGIHDSAKRWVSTCDICHRIKPNNALPYGLTMPLPIPGERGDRINIDFITKMPASEKGNDTIVTIVDSLTKRVRWVATKEEGLTAEAFADLFIEHYVRTRGLPTAIVSDRDPRFTSVFWRTVCTRLGIKQKMSTAFYPQTDGLAENANGVVERYLKAYIAADPKHWDRHLPLAEFTYNASRHKALKVEPFVADIGRIPSLPLDLQLPTRPRTNTNSDGAQDFLDHLATVLRRAKQCLQEAQIDMVIQSDKRRRPHPFKVGDSVFLNTRKLPIGYANLQHHENDEYGGPASRKFQHEFSGPFTILDLRGNVATLDIPQNWLQPRTYNVNRLRLDRVDRGRPHPPPPALRSTKAGAEYEVEKLLDHRGNTVKTLQYHVKWAGQDLSEADWQPLANLRSGCKRFLREYHEKHGLRVYKWMQEADD